MLVAYAARKVGRSGSVTKFAEVFALQAKAALPDWYGAMHFPLREVFRTGGLRFERVDVSPPVGTVEDFAAFVRSAPGFKLGAGLSADGVVKTP